MSELRMSQYRVLFIFVLSVLVTVSASGDDSSIMIYGRLSENLKIRYSVNYETTRDHWWCKHYNFLAGISASERKSYYYEVLPKNDMYKVIIPLSKIPSNTFCRWRSKTISFSVTSVKLPDGYVMKSGMEGVLFYLRRNNYRVARHVKIECFPMLVEYGSGKSFRCRSDAARKDGALAIDKMQTSVAVDVLWKKLKGE